jgi:hypothetical protein
VVCVALMGEMKNTYKILIGKSEKEETTQKTWA